MLQVICDYCIINKGLRAFNYKINILICNFVRIIQYFFNEPTF